MNGAAFEPIEYQSNHQLQHTLRHPAFIDSPQTTATPRLHSTPHSAQSDTLHDYTQSPNQQTRDDDTLNAEFNHVSMVSKNKNERILQEKNYT